MANFSTSSDNIEQGTPQKNLSFSEIINMSVGFMGIQIGFELQNGNMSRIFQSFGVQESDLPFLWLAAPMTGLLIQPIVGYFSDRTWHPKYGRRRPYFMLGAILATLSLLIMPNSPALWVAAGMFWIMDSSFNITMEPFRAVIGDKLPVSQRTLGFSIQTIFIGFGAWIASQLPSLFTSLGVSNVPLGAQSIPDTVRYSFYIGAVGFLAFVLYTVFTTKENPPSAEQLAEMEADKKGIFDGIIASFVGIKDMPKEMIQLAACQFFSWLALFHMWIYMTPAVTRHIFGVAEGDSSSALYNEGANVVNEIGGWRTIVSVIVAFMLPYAAAKLGRKVVHAICLALGGLALVATAYITDPGYLNIAAIGLGFAWASILTMPYAMLTNILPPNRLGYFVGVFNFFIVLPQIVAGFGSKFYLQLINGDAMTAITIGGFSFLIAAVLSLFVQDKGKTVA